MDIKTTPPEKYASWLLSLGVQPEELADRMCHDMLRALSKQLDEMGTPEGYYDLKLEVDALLAADAVERVTRE